MSFRPWLTRVLLGLAACGGLLAAVDIAPAPGPTAAPAFTRTLYLIRHGAYDSKQPGDEDVVNGLTPLGREQSRLTAGRLRAMPVEFSSLTCSTMTRARQTAEIIGGSFPQLKLEATPALRECLPRTHRSDVTKGKAPAELDAAEAQLNRVFAKYFVPAREADRHDIVVCHGNVIRYLVMKALGVDPEAWLGLAVANCSLTIIQVSPQDGLKVLAVGDAGHLPPNLQSGLGRPDPPYPVP